MGEQEELIACPLCRKIIHRHDARPATSKARISSRTSIRDSSALMTEMMADIERSHQERIAVAEKACRLHYENHHKARTWLWKRTHWGALMNKRWLFFGSDAGEAFYTEVV